MHRAESLATTSRGVFDALTVPRNASLLRTPHNDRNLQSYQVSLKQANVPIKKRFHQLFTGKQTVDLHL